MRTSLLHRFATTAKFVGMAAIALTATSAADQSGIRAEEIRSRRHRYRNQDRPDRAVLRPRLGLFVDRARPSSLISR